MIGITQNDLRLYILQQLLLCKGFHTADGPNRHKDGCQYLPMIGGDLAGPCLGTGISMLQLKL